jgi:hypothetical protein
VQGPSGDEFPKHSNCLNHFLWDEICSYSGTEEGRGHGVLEMELLIAHASAFEAKNGIRAAVGLVRDGGAGPCGACAPEPALMPRFTDGLIPAQVKGLLGSMMLTYDDIGRVQVMSKSLSEDEPELVGDPVATRAIAGETADSNPALMTEGELATVGNV